VEFGVFYEVPVPYPRDPQGELRAFRDCVAMAELAERAGFASFWTSEHHFLDEFSHSSAPGVLDGAIAARTERIRIGRGVDLLSYPYTHPVRTAEEAATVDLLSEGRLDLIAGRSSTRAELEGFGIRPDDTLSMWEEALRVVIGAWTEDVFHFEGKHFAFPARAVVPKPYQRPHPPLWAAARSPASHERVGRQGLGLLSATLGSAPEAVAPRIARYRVGLAEAEPIGQFVNARAAALTLAHAAGTTREAIADARASFEWYVQEGAKQLRALARWRNELATGEPSPARLEGFADLDPRILTFDALDSVGACLVGDAERVIRGARRYAAAGCEILFCVVQPHAIPHDAVRRSLALFGEHVIPALRG
jgi:alkanesulfonate monooxygenase SsuD/methylene tetrahydromethanopterin reductase-like flavin-dependent oxidoreductase (luciferase family)